MKQPLLLIIALLCSLCASAQSLTPTVIATAGFGYSSPELQVDMTIGETFIFTLQTPDVILTQGFHQPEALQGGGCINATLIDPDAICSLQYDPVCGCDGVTYTNSCVAQTTAGVTTWTLGECGGGGDVLGCTMPDACNYDTTATVDNGSCYFVGDACDDGYPESINDMIDLDCNCYGEMAVTLGCTFLVACNFDFNANSDDGSCFFVGDACDDANLGTENDVIIADCICAGEPNGQTPGCTAVEACNYNAAATIDDGSCTLPGEPCDDDDATTGFDMLGADCVCVGMLLGCTEPLACNYNELALLDDGTCYFNGDACDDGNPETQNDGWNADCVCAGEIVGCTAMSACNYNPAATVNDFSCVFMGDVCDDGLSETINDVYGFDCMCAGEVVSVAGCTEPNACNYDMSATTDDGSCFFVGVPCDDGDMMTINDVITLDCMCAGETLAFLGCTNADACNYNSGATIDDGSCFFVGDTCDDGDANTNNDVYNTNCQCEGTVGVQELEANIQLFPNPATNEVIVTINGLAPTEVQIFDAAGRFVMNAQRTSRIDIHTLAAGVYTFRVMQDGGIWEQKIVKQN